MNKALILKILGMLGLILLMSIAVNYVNHIILERMQYQNQVKRDIARSSAGQQTITGPVLAIPYTEEYTDYIDEVTPKGVSVKKPVTKRVTSTHYILPERLQLSGQFDNEYKKLGIYKALMYQLGGSINGSFRIPADNYIQAKHKGGIITLHDAYIGIGISDTRGITGKPTFSLNGKEYKFEQGSQIKSLGKGIHANLGKLMSPQAQQVRFAINLNLLGMEHFSFTPIAETNSIQLSSDWQHPHFSGSFLPLKKAIGADGFKGEWAISSLSSSNQGTLINHLGSNQKIGSLETLSVGFVEPINVYSQADRATKYGLMFIGLTFVGFFLFEVLKQLRIHPAQYTLVGLSMAMFYLLLVSFAEMIGFASAYLIASSACIVLLGYYLSFVLKSILHGLTFAGLLTALYGALYGILASEDNALIMGSLLVFGLLAATMVITRKVDWYAINMQKS